MGRVVDAVKLVVGLGNPGRKYDGTRHNVGFAVLAELARRYGRSRPRAAFQGELLEADIKGTRVWLLSPITFMNRSGECVRQACDFYKLPLEELLIVCDDFNLPLGKLRMRAQGSAGGQRGLEDIIRRMGTQQFARLRMGIGPVPPRWDPAEFVLSRFTKDEQAELQLMVVRAGDAVVDWVGHGTEYAMNQYNA